METESTSHLEVQVISGIEWITSKMVQTEEKVYEFKYLIRLAKKGKTISSIYNPFHEILFNNNAGRGLINLSILGKL